MNAMFFAFALIFVISTPVIPPPGEKVSDSPYFNRIGCPSIARSFSCSRALFPPARLMIQPIAASKIGSGHGILGGPNSDARKVVGGGGKGIQKDTGGRVSGVAKNASILLARDEA